MCLLTVLVCCSQSLQDNLAFCRGLALLVPRLPAKQAQEAGQQLDEVCAQAVEGSQGGDEGLPEPLAALRQALQERLDKARGIKSALRRPRGSAAKGTRGPRRRYISLPQTSGLLQIQPWLHQAHDKVPMAWHQLLAALTAACCT